MSGSSEQHWWSWHQCIMAISHLMRRIPKLMRFMAGERLEKLSAMSRNICLRDVEEVIKAVKSPFSNDGVTVLDIGETDPL